MMLVVTGRPASAQSVDDVISQKWRELPLGTLPSFLRPASPGQFATAWVLNNALVTSVIAGPRTEAQLEDYLGALTYRLTAEDEALVDGFVAPGHNSTPNYTDPVEPVAGRPLAS